MNSQRGFTMIEIILTATMLAIISTPFLLGLTNLGFRYRNLRISYYAQLAAQTNIETIINILQGINPSSGASLEEYKNLFCDKVTTPCTGISNVVPSIRYINFNQSGEITTISEPSSPTYTPIINTIDNNDYTTDIMIAPVCRTGNDLTKSTIPDGSCQSGTSQDPNSLEIIINTTWDPPGPLSTSSYRISTLFTEFNPL